MIDTDAAPPGTLIGTGRLLRINVSDGGVPKREVPSARIGRLGVSGDRQRERGVHGGPMRAVSLLAIEAIWRVAAEGHPLEPGGAGENLTTEGVELALLPVGTVLAIGDSVRLEISGAALPCKTIRFNFRDGRFGRLSPVAHPTDSRVYARVLAEGDVRSGDTISVFAAHPDAGAVLERRLRALDVAEASSVEEFWRAIAHAELDLRIQDDGDYLAGAAPDLAGPPFNMAYGLDWVPTYLPDAIALFRTAGQTGWLQMRDRPWPGAEPDTRLQHFGAHPDEIAPAGAPAGVALRRAGPADAAAWAALFDDGLHPPTSRERAAWTAGAAGRLASSQTEVHVAEADGQIVAGGIVHVRHGVAWLRSGIVLPRWRRRGIHRALVAARVRAAAERGCDLVGASAVAGSASAANLRAMGFDELAVRGQYRVEGARERG